MQAFFKNVDPAEIAEPGIRAIAQRLWIGDVSDVAAAAERILQIGDVTALCVLFDVYSYSNTTEGLYLDAALSPFQSALVMRARHLLDGIWSGEIEVGSVRDAMVASAMHVVWRAVDMADSQRVLHALEHERDSRVVVATVSAASLMRGNDRIFDRRVAPLLADVARRHELSTLVRRLAVEAFSFSPSVEDLRILTDLIPALPPAEAAAGALILLDSDVAYYPLVKDVAGSWQELDEYPVPDVLDRLAAWEKGAGEA